jgi:hypothetical protein
MSVRITRLKPLFLSEEEALAMLDLCLLSNAETHPEAECALMKLTELVRRFIAENIVAEHAVVRQRNGRGPGVPPLPETGAPSVLYATDAGVHRRPASCEGDPLHVRKRTEADRTYAVDA